MVKSSAGIRVDFKGSNVILLNENCNGTVYSPKLCGDLAKGESETMSCRQDCSIRRSLTGRSIEDFDNENCFGRKAGVEWGGRKKEDR